MGGDALRRPAEAVEVGRLPDQRPLAVVRPRLVEGQPDPPGKPFHEVHRGDPGIDVGGQVGQRREHRGEHLVQARREALGEVVLEVEGRKEHPQGMGAGEALDQAPHEDSTSTW